MRASIGYRCHLRLFASRIVRSWVGLWERISIRIRSKTCGIPRLLQRLAMRHFMGDPARTIHWLTGQCPYDRAQVFLISRIRLAWHKWTIYLSYRLSNSGAIDTDVYWWTKWSQLNNQWRMGMTSLNMQAIVKKEITPVSNKMMSFWCFSTATAIADITKPPYYLIIFD